MVPLPPQYPVQLLVPFHAAEFRSDQRVRKRKVTALQLDQDQCRQLFKQACIAMKERVGAAVVKIKGKRNPNAELEEERRENARGELLGAKRLPAGIMGKIVGLAKETLGRDDLEASVLGCKTGDAEYRLREWRATLRSHVYDSAWDTAVQVEDEDKKGSRSDIDVNFDSSRACTATLRQTMRKDVLPHFDRIVSLAEDAQTIVSNVMEEMAVIMQKTVHTIVAGHLYPNMPTPLPALDIRTSLPAGFSIRDQYLCTLLPVASLPMWLEEHLEDEKAHTTSNLFKLLSQAHLEFMYIRILRPARPQLAKAEERHSI
ncbi:hypothetical protein BGZ98_007297 [Dissophora globulifera]|nr:hypothetical protein BGZ98_007297 [Dissophora globulifera]